MRHQGPWYLAAGLVAGAVGGFAAGHLTASSEENAARRRAAETGQPYYSREVLEESVKSLRRDLDAEGDKRRSAERSLADLRAEVDAAREAAEAARATAGPAPASAASGEVAAGAAAAPGGKSAAEVAARLADVPKEIEAAFAAKDGKKALSLLKELAGLGRDAWPVAAKLMADI
jgi:hypothetical protein